MHVTRCPLPICNKWLVPSATYAAMISSVLHTLMRENCPRKEIDGHLLQDTLL